MSPEDVAYSVDFETYYDDECSVVGTGPWGYCHHPKFQPLLVAIKGPDIEYAGPVDQAPWSEISGHVWVSHNVPFDCTVFRRCQELGLVPQGVGPSEDDYGLCWVDTADLACFLRAPRSLAHASRVLLGMSLSKSIRDKEMKGLTLDKLVADGALYERVRTYALRDACASYRLWAEFGPVWPEEELKASRLTILSTLRGIPVDVDLLNDYIRTLRTALFVAKDRIPWAEDDAALLSYQALAQACRDAGVEVPVTTEAKSREFKDWEAKYGHKAPFVRAVQDYRKINRLLRICETAKARVRDDGRLDLGVLYFGAQVTGRWSGSPREKDESSINLQNLPRQPLYLDEDYRVSDTPTERQVDLRAIIAAPRLGICDLAQIEPRVTMWLTDDKEQLELVRSGVSIYEAHARKTMGWSGGRLKAENPDLYALAKARVLSLGYGAGPEKFLGAAYSYLSSESVERLFGVKPPAELETKYVKLVLKRSSYARDSWSAMAPEDRRKLVNAWGVVQDFRCNNPAITRYWKLLGNAAWSSARTDHHLTLTLPSGRTLEYYDVHARSREIVGSTCRGLGSRAATKLYGGRLFENVVQAVARDVFRDCLIRIHESGYRILFTVHDEVVVELQDGQSVEEVERLMSVPPLWAPDLPVAAEGKETSRYTK